MTRYHIIIDLSNGRQVDAKVVGTDEKDAMARLKARPEYAAFVGKATVVSEKVVEIMDVSIDKERFAVTAISQRPGWYVIADLDNLLKVEWQRGMYNETQKVLPIGQGKELSATEAATAMREIGEFLHDNFLELI